MRKIHRGRLPARCRPVPGYRSAAAMINESGIAHFLVQDTDSIGLCRRPNGTNSNRPVRPGRRSCGRRFRAPGAFRAGEPAHRRCAACQAASEPAMPPPIDVDRIVCLFHVSGFRVFESIWKRPCKALGAKPVGPVPAHKNKGAPDPTRIVWNLPTLGSGSDAASGDSDPLGYSVPGDTRRACFSMAPRSTPISLSVAS